MKRRTVIIVLCLVVAVGVLISAARIFNSHEKDVRQTVTVSRGDAAQTEGLSVTTELTFEQKLLWSITRNVAAGTDETAYSYHANGIPLHYGSDEDTVLRFTLALRLCDTREETDPISLALAEKDEGGGVTSTVSLWQYYDTYPLALCYGYDTQSLQNLDCVLVNEDFATALATFDALQIPVETDDWASLYFAQDGGDASARYASLNVDHLTHRFTPYTAEAEGGILLAVGFAADAQPKAEWAPEGFGVWFIPTEDNSSTALNGLESVDVAIHPEQAKLAYPLDIEKQSVLNLARSADGSCFFLVTAEADEAVLHVLDAAYHEVNTVSLGTIGTHGQHRELVLDDGNQVVLDTTDYDAVRIHTEADFTAIAAGEYLTVLLPQGKGCGVDFQCELVTLCSVSQEEGNTYYCWSDEENLQGGESCYTNSPADDHYGYSFQALPMAYRDHKLAVAWYDEYDLATHLHVYGAEGLLYGERTEFSLTREDSGSMNLYLPNYAPTLSWS